MKTLLTLILLITTFNISQAQEVITRDAHKVKAIFYEEDGTYTSILLSDEVQVMFDQTTDNYLIEYVEANGKTTYIFFDNIDINLYKSSKGLEHRYTYDIMKRTISFTTVEPINNGSYAEIKVYGITTIY